jgi:hypothetical protein
VTGGSCGAITGGCIRSLDVTGNAFPNSTTVNAVVMAAPAGTGLITIDNVSTVSGASSVYYTTRTPGRGGTGGTIVKATQAALQ